GGRGRAGGGGPVGRLAQRWVDSGRPGSSGATFGAMSAITAGGRDVQAGVVDSRTVQVSFRPRSDGSFRVVVDAPHWVGGDALATAHRQLGGAAEQPLRAAHSAWWHSYWSHVGVMR